MAKISPVSIKYIIHAKFEASGAIEKSDMIGAVFGQTEGLLGEDLEMRELQKTGKIGRIEVNIEYQEGKTIGEIEVPTAMDKTETTIIAAALETIERVGPTDTKITVEEIEDVRGSKRDYILERAKKLMEKFGGEEKEVNEMAEEIKDSAKLAKLQTYGTENIPCGDISGDELIIVEGRADVINMLKKGIKNVIAMNGTKLPESIIRLSKDKETVILFVDGDRGGNLIIKNVTENAKIDYIAMAPEGKEVEELTGKEILQSLRKKIPAESYKIDQRSKGVRSYYENNDLNIKKITPKEKELITTQIEDLVGTKGAILFDKDLEIIKKIPASRLINLDLEEQPYIIAMDGTATPRIIENCERLGCDNLIANNFVNSDTRINLISM
ncbi:MAG: DNA primase DnaG [Nanoarchaeota archaeon]